MVLSSGTFQVFRSRTWPQIPTVEPLGSGGLHDGFINFGADDHAEMEGSEHEKKSCFGVAFSSHFEPSQFLKSFSA